MKAYKKGAVSYGLKNCEVVDGNAIHRCFYPDTIPLAAILDAPLDAVLRWF